MNRRPLGHAPDTPRDTLESVPRNFMRDNPGHTRTHPGTTPCVPAPLVKRGGTHCEGRALSRLTVRLLQAMPVTGRPTLRRVHYDSCLPGDALKDAVRELKDRGFLLTFGSALCRVELTPTGREVWGRAKVLVCSGTAGAAGAHSFASDCDSESDFRNG